MVARLKKVSTLPKLKTIQKASQIKRKGIFRKKLEVKRVISRRGRESAMEAPKAVQPQQPQNIFLDSTAINSFEYSIRKQVLTIWFVKGGAWEYFDVPQGKVYELANAPSKGHYFYYNIRTQYRFKRIE